MITEVFSHAIRELLSLSRGFPPVWTAGCCVVVALTLTPELRAAEKKAAGESAETKPRFGPMLAIESKFVEMTPPLREPGPALALLKADPNVATIAAITDGEFQAVIRALNERKGVDLLSAPRLNTRSGQNAEIEIIREFRYATAWEKEGKGWKGTKFATRDLGVKLSVLAQLKSEGTIELLLEPSVTELVGFVDVDSGRKYPSPKAKGAGRFDPMRAAPPGRRLNPVFSERKGSHRATIANGNAVVLGNLKEKTDAPGFAPSVERQLTVFVSARTEPPEAR